MAAYRRVDDLTVTCLYTGISSGPNARYRVWEAFTFFLPETSLLVILWVGLCRGSKFFFCDELGWVGKSIRRIGWARPKKMDHGQPCWDTCPFTSNNLIFGRPFVKRFALCYRSVVCLSCRVCLSVCLSVLPVTFVHGGQTV